MIVEVRAGNWGNKKGSASAHPVAIIKPWVLAGGLGGEMFFPLGMWQGARVEIVPNGPPRAAFPGHEAGGHAADATLHLSVEVLTVTHSLEFKLHPTGNTQMRYYRDWWNAPQKRQGPHARSGSWKTRQAALSPFARPSAVEALPGRNWVEAGPPAAHSQALVAQWDGQPESLSRQAATLKRKRATVDTASSTTVFAP